MTLPFPYDPNIRSAYLANLAKKKLPPRKVPVPAPSTTMGPNRPAVDPYAAPVDPWAEAQKRAKQMSDPILEAYRQQQAADTQAAQQWGENWGKSIEGLYQQARPQIQGSYDQAISAGSRIEDAVSKHLANAGTQSVDELQQKLAQMGAPNGGAESLAQLSGIWKGTGGAEFALGAGQVENLIANKASADTWLTKQEIIDRKEVGAKVLEQIGQIAHDYGLKREDVLTHMPEQVNALYDKYAEQAAADRDFKYKQKMDKVAVAADKRDFSYKKKQDILAAQDARHKLALEEKLTAQQTMSEQAYKVWAKKYDAKQKELDRQTKVQLAAADRAAKTTDKVTGQDFTGPANRKYITVQDANGNPQVVSNPNYVPPVKKPPSKDSSDTVETAGSAKRQRAYDKALASVFNDTTGHVRDVVAYAKDPDMKALHLINAALKGIGVEPYSKAGNQIRQSLWSFLDGKPAGTGETAGTFLDPRRRDARFRKKKKK